MTKPSGQSRAYIQCGYCDYRCIFPASKVGEIVKCPRCGDSVKVRRKRRRSGVVEAPVVDVEIEFDGEPPPVRDKSEYEKPQKRLEPEVPKFVDGPKPTQWWLFSDAVEVLLFPSAALRALCLSFGLMILADVSRFGYIMHLDAVQLYDELGTLAQAVVVFVCGLPLVFVGFWTLVYGGTCYAAIAEATAAGNERYVDWPDQNYAEWIGRSASVLYVGALSMAFAVGIGRLADVYWPGAYWYATPYAFFLLHPLLLLGALEIGHPWAPFSVPIVLTIFRAPLWWATFLFLVAVITTFVIGVLHINYRLNGLRSTMIVAAPLLAHYLFVHARLLGRLGWKIQDSGIHLYLDDDE